jgi:hypothetical protein
MLEVCTNLEKLPEFAKRFAISISQVPSSDIITQCESIFQHHADTSIFLGFLEPGWMLSPEDQTRMRPIFRKFKVGFVCVHKESIPFSWKNGIETVYS